MYSHIDSPSFFVDGNIFLISGNDLKGCEMYNLRTEVLQEAPHLSAALTSDHQIISEIRSQFYIIDNYVHTNPAFRKLYIFGVDIKKEIWRYSFSNFKL